MSIDRGMDKEDEVHICNGILVIKRNKIMPSTVTWIDIKIVILNEVSQIKMNII